MVLGAWVASAIFGLSAPTAAVATTPVSQLRTDQSSTLAEADTARRAGDLAEADRLYRIAWQDPRVRSRAAAALRSLERDGHRLPVNQAQLEETSRLLGETFKVYETDHFVILSDAPRHVALAKLNALERAHHQFYRAMARLEFDAIPPAHKLLCVLFADHAMYRAFASAHDRVDAGWVAGYYSGMSNRAVFYEDNTGPTYAAAGRQLQEAEAQARELEAKAREARRAKNNDLARQIAAQAEHLNQRIQSERARLSTQAKESSISKTIHEAIHLLAFNAGVQSRAHEYPFWLTEGLATSFETDQPTAAFGPDRPSAQRDEELKAAFGNGHAVRLRELVSMLEPPGDDPLATEAVYAQAWSLFSHLHRTERRAITGFLNDMRNEPPGRLTAQRRVELFEKNFGDIERLESRWLRQLGMTTPTLAAATPE